MAYQGMADLSALAEFIATSAINGNWSDCKAKIKELNGSQAIVLYGCLKDLLSNNHLETLSKVVRTTMNEGETGFGYLAENEEDDDEYDDEDEDSRTISTYLFGE
jgi:hypothetical protein